MSLKLKSVSEHMHAFHKAAHANHLEAIANHEDALSKAAGSEPHEKFLKAEIARHTAMAAHHEAGMAECAKAIEAESLQKRSEAEPLPEGFSRVAPDRPRAIPRTGQRELPATAQVDARFQKMVSVETGEETDLTGAPTI
jgi:hypothetical protein